MHPAKDGHVAGPVIWQQLEKMVPWMKEAGAIDDAWLAREQWEDYDFRLFRGDGFAIEPDELNDKVDAFLAEQTKETIFARGLELGVTLAPIMSIEELLTFPQLLARGLLPGSETAQRRFVPSARRLREMLQHESGHPLASAPSIGEHTAEEVLDELVSHPEATGRLYNTNILTFPTVRRP